MTKNEVIGWQKDGVHSENATQVLPRQPGQRLEVGSTLHGQLTSGLDGHHVSPPLPFLALHVRNVVFASLVALLGGCLQKMKALTVFN